jgi:hypothetical protein
MFSLFCMRSFFRCVCHLPLIIRRQLKPFGHHGGCKRPCVAARLAPGQDTCRYSLQNFTRECMLYSAIWVCVLFSSRLLCSPNPSPLGCGVFFSRSMGFIIHFACHARLLLDTGRVYYLNDTTKTTQWTFPIAGASHTLALFLVHFLYSSRAT